MSPVLSVVEKASPASSSIQFDSSVERLDKVGEGHDLNVNGNTSEDTGKQAPDRCMSCRKRIGLTGFKCRCGGTFCSVHRYSEKHDCSFDYRTAG